MNLENLQGQLAILENSYASDHGEGLLKACSSIAVLVENWHELKQAEVKAIGYSSLDHLRSHLSNVIFDFVDRCLLGQTGYMLVQSLQCLDTQGAFVDHLEKWRSQAGVHHHEFAVSALDQALLDYGSSRIFEVEFDVDYAESDHLNQCFDIYRPLNAGDALKPAILYFHGGAWEYGDRFNAIKRLRLYHDLGIVFISVGYRLSNDVTWPKPMEDCINAANYVFENAESFGIDPARIGVWGSSSGAHLGGLLVGNLMNKTPRDYSCFINFCGPIALNRYVEVLEGEARAESPVMKLLGGEHEKLKEFAEEATVSNWVSSAFPTSCIVHGEKDEVVPHQESIYLDDLLKKSGVNSEFHLMPDTLHRLNDFVLVDKVSDFLKRQMG